MGGKQKKAAEICTGLGRLKSLWWNESFVEGGGPCETAVDAALVFLQEYVEADPELDYWIRAEKEALDRYQSTNETTKMKYYKDVADNARAIVTRLTAKA